MKLVLALLLLASCARAEALTARIRSDSVGAIIRNANGDRTSKGGGNIAEIDAGASRGLYLGQDLDVMRAIDGRQITVGIVRVGTIRGEVAAVIVISGVPNGLQPEDLFRPSVGDTNFPRLVPQSAHTLKILGIAFSPDGQYLTSIDSNGLKLWSIADRAMVQQRDAGVSSFCAIAATQNVECPFVTGTSASDVMFWQMPRLNSTVPIRAGERSHAPIACIATARDTGRIALIVQYEDSLYVWDSAQDRPKLLADRNSNPRPEAALDGETVAISANGRFVAAPCVGTRPGVDEDGESMPQRVSWLGVWDASIGKCVCELPDADVIIDGVAMSPTESLVASTTKGGVFEVWDWRARKQLFDGNGCGAVVFSPSGDRLAVATKKGDLGLALVEPWRVALYAFLPRLAIWLDYNDVPHYAVDVRSIPDGHIIATLDVGDEKVRRLAFSRDGRFLAAAVDRGSGSGVKVWEVNGLVSVGELGVASAQHARALATSNDGLYLAVLRGLGRNEIDLWDLMSGRSPRVVALPQGDYDSICFVPGKKMICVSGAFAKPAFVAMDDVLSLVPGPAELPRGRSAWSPDGTFWLIAGGFHVTQRYLASTPIRVTTVPRIADSEVQLLRKGKGDEGIIEPQVSVMVTADAEHWISADESGFVKCSRVSDNAVVWARQLAGDQPSVSPKGNFVATFRGTEVALHKAKAGDLVWSQPAGFFAGPIAFSPDETIVAVASVGTVSVFNVASGKLLWSYTERGIVDALTFSPDGQTFVCAMGNGTVAVFSVERCELLARLGRTAGGGWSVQAPNGRFDVGDLFDVPTFRWVFDDDPFHGLSPFLYMRDYYEPRLLARLLRPKNGKLEEEFNPVRPLQSLNRAQSVIGKPRVEWLGNSGRVAVSVDVADGTYAVLGGESWKTEVYDLRLLRDGQLVCECPEPKDDAEPLPDGNSEPELKAWRERTHVTPRNDRRVEQHPDGSATVRFEVGLPHRPGQKLQFTAYAFNRDRVRSGTGEAYPVFHRVFHDN